MEFTMTSNLRVHFSWFLNTSVTRTSFIYRSTMCTLISLIRPYSLRTKKCVLASDYVCEGSQFCGIGHFWQAKSDLSFTYTRRALDRAFWICLHQDIPMSKSTPRCLTDVFQAISLLLMRSSGGVLFFLGMKKLVPHFTPDFIFCDIKKNLTIPLEKAADKTAVIFSLI